MGIKRGAILYKATKDRTGRPKFWTEILPGLRKKYKPGQKIKILMTVDGGNSVEKDLFEFTVIKAYPYHVSVADRYGIRSSFQYVELEQARSQKGTA